MTDTKNTENKGDDIRFFPFAGDSAKMREIVEKFRQTLFPALTSDYVHERLAFIAQPDLLLASSGEEFVGFKLGYRTSERLFFSWLGGVDDRYRRRGIASALTQLQHDRAKECGVTAIETRTRADNNAMIVVNLKAGFHIVGVEADAFGRFVVLQRKDLL